MIVSDVFERLKLIEAVERELSSRNRLMPRRLDYHALAKDPQAVERWLRPGLRQGACGSPADVVFADKGWRGSRPLNVMALRDRVLYQALVALLAAQMPARFSQRLPTAEFRNAPLLVPDVAYISKTDVSSYYEYVDHDILGDELVAQTGDEFTVNSLVELLHCVMGRRVGIPQVHKSSDVLGDAYIDPVRRAMTRLGYAVFTYSDDFRIATGSLGSARTAVEICAAEVRKIGLVLNDRKTYTYRVRKYLESLGSFALAEQGLFVDEQHGSDELTLLLEGYSDDDLSDDEELSLGPRPIHSDIEEAEALDHDEEPGVDDTIDGRRVRAAGRAWDLWLEEDESEEVQSAQSAAVTQSLVGLALPVLAAAGDSEPLPGIAMLLRYEPALAPETAAYLTIYARSSRSASSRVRSVLDDVSGLDILSPWQSMWLAQAAGTLQGTRASRKHVEWLADCVVGAPPGLAATAAAALGRLRIGEPEMLAAALNRVGPEWRQLILWGLGQLDMTLAEGCAESQLDRILLANSPHER